MNRKGRARLRNALECYDAAVRQAAYELEQVLEGLRQEEEDKYDRLPDQLRDSAKGEQLEESISQLEEFSEASEGIVEILDDMVDSAGVASTWTPSKPHGTELPGQGLRNTAFHALLPSGLATRLKDESRLQCVSMNEMVCRVLTEALAPASL